MINNWKPFCDGLVAECSISLITYKNSYDEVEITDFIVVVSGRKFMVQYYL